MNNLQYNETGNPLVVDAAYVAGYKPSEHSCFKKITASYDLFENDRRRAVKLESD
jgi:hypothetical protein